MIGKDDVVFRSKRLGLSSLTCVFNSPEPKAHGELLSLLTVRRRRRRRLRRPDVGPSTIFKHISS